MCIASKKIHLMNLERARSFIEDLDLLMVIGTKDDESFDITEFCSLNFSKDNMQSVIEQMDDAIFTLRLEISMEDAPKIGEEGENDGQEKEL